MKNVLVTGSAGFIGRNLLQALRRRTGVSVSAFDVGNAPGDLDGLLKKADVVFHLAGVNRPPDPGEYESGNAGLTRDLIARLEALRRTPHVALSSSTQAALDNPYGRSKRAAEEALTEWAERSGAPVSLFRLPNVFGKWCRPNYNSGVATFCHNIARGLEISVSDRSRVLELVYVDDVARALVGLLDSVPEIGARFREVEPTFSATLGQIVDALYDFRATRNSLLVPDFGDPFVKRLYATYLSYLPAGDFAYPLVKREDARGALVELLKAPAFGQIFVSRTKPGVTRGNHFHDTKTEKFCVLEGEALIRFRSVEGGEVLEYRISGRDFKVVDIPPGYTHSIENVGPTEMIVLFWASEPFDPARPDTYPLEVLND